MDNENVVVLKSEKVYHRDGWGYIVSGDQNEVTIQYFETNKEGNNIIKQTFSISCLAYNEVAQAILNVGIAPSKY